MSINIKSALVCDDIRQEVSGKFLLIGVYTNEINFKNIPTNFSAQFWVEAEPWINDGDMEFEIRIDVPGKKAVRQNSLSMAVKREDLANIIVRAAGLPNKKEGYLTFWIKKKGGRWQKLLSTKIGLLNSPPPAS
jgi:hypothetical protein